MELQNVKQRQSNTKPARLQDSPITRPSNPVLCKEDRKPEVRQTIPDQA